MTMKVTPMRVTSNGRVTIPKHIREKLGIILSSEVEFIEGKGRVYLRRSRQDVDRKVKLQSLRGIATVKMTTRQILALTRGE